MIENAKDVVAYLEQLYKVTNDEKLLDCINYLKNVVILDKRKLDEINNSKIDEFNRSLESVSRKLDDIQDDIEIIKRQNDE